MSWVIILIVVVFTAGIAYMGSSAGSKNRPRKDLMADFSRLVEGEMIDTEGYENSYQIRFDFENHDFLYEDTEMQGFNDKVYKSFLKMEVGMNLTLAFGEKRSKKLIGSSSSSNDGIVKLPKEFSEFGAYSNNPKLAEQLLDNSKVIKIFRSFKNVDPRGKAFLALKISSGTIVIEFDSTGKYVPKPLHYLSEASSVEYYLDQLIYIKKVIHDISL